MGEHDRNGAGMEVIRRFVINREGIGLFKAMLESYEDIGIFSVLDGKKGLIELIYPRNYEDEMLAIVKDMESYGIVCQEVGDV
jgi:hypothetical protein